MVKSLKSEKAKWKRNGSEIEAVFPFFVGHWGRKKSIERKRRMVTMTDALRERLTRNERIQRAIKTIADAQARSQQPRLSAPQTNTFFNSVYWWVEELASQEPAYQVDSRARDAWLSRYWMEEPHLAGVIDSVVNIDKNRAWALTGGRNQVNRYTAMLREAEAGEGWRYFMNQQALSFYTTDLGALAELGRDGVGGPVRALYNLDSTLCRLTGEFERPLRYDKNKEAWSRDDFFRVVSLPSPREEMMGLGFCAVSRVLKMSRLMIAVYQHDQEQLDATSAKGLLLLKGVSEQQWQDAMAARTQLMTAREQDYYGGVSVLASQTDDISATLVALSQLPAGFNIETTTNLLMYCYALCFGYDPREFWPTSQGSLGTGKESEVQHQKATGKGGADFMLSFQDRVQSILPPTLTFEFEQRDSEGMLLEAQVMQAWADVANTLFQNGMGVLTREQTASLLVAQGMIPAEWTETIEATMATDTKDAPDEDAMLGEDQAAANNPTPATPQDANQSPANTQARRLKHLREKALEDENVRRAAVRFPQEPIIRTFWPSGKTLVLWQRGEDALSPTIWRVAKPDALLLPASITRVHPEDVILYQDGEVTITEADVEDAISEGYERQGAEYADLLHARTLTEAEINSLADKGG